MSDSQLFISKFCQWAHDTHMPSTSFRKLPNLLRHVFDEELPSRDRWSELVVRSLTESQELSCYYVSDNSCLFPSDGALRCAVVMPPWRRGWRNVAKDELLEDLLSGFFHLASQYVSRSLAVSMQCGLALAYGRACDFHFGNILTMTGVGPGTPFETIQEALNSLLSEPSNSVRIVKSELWRGRERQLSSWINLNNGLDPYIHRASFQFIRSVRLYEGGFDEEAMTALDGITSIAAQFVRERLGIMGDDRRKVLFAHVDLPESVQKKLRRIQELRSYFGAHPGKSRWWDFGETYENGFAESFEASKFLLWKMFHLERNNRLVSFTPDRWSGFFSQNAVMLWDSVWEVPV